MSQYHLPLSELPDKTEPVLYQHNYYKPDESVLFSAVTITSDSDQAEFLVAGVPKSYADLEGWTAFESFMDEVDTEQDIKVHVAACLYGEGEVFTATPEEVAYFTIRAAETDDFFYDPA